jgi:hypothetical protein
VQQPKLIHKSDDGRWAMDDAPDPIVYRPLALFRRSQKRFLEKESSLYGFVMA